MKRVATSLLLLFLMAPFASGQGGFAPKGEMIAKSDVIAVVEITQVTSDPMHSRQGYQDAAATVQQVLKGGVQEKHVIGFEIPRSRSGESIPVSTGQYLVFLSGKGKGLTGNNGHMSYRPIKDGKLDWYKDDRSFDASYALEQWRLAGVLEEVRKILKDQQQQGQSDGESTTASAQVRCEVFFAVKGRSSLDVAVEAIQNRQMPSYVIGANEHCTVVGYQPAAHPTSRTLAKALGLREVPTASHLKPGDVESAAKKALGDAFLKVEGERVSSANVSEFCKGCKFYVVQTKWHSKNPPTNILEEKPLLAMLKDATFLINSYEAALRFLSSFKEPVTDEAACLSRCMAFFELTNGDLRTRMPLKGSIIEMYKKQDPKDWDLVISGTDGGWRVRATASVNREIDFCIRFEINVGNDGTLSLVSHRTIYAYTLYK